MSSTSFLSRYKLGNYVEVWNEIIYLGKSVRSTEYFDDVYAVAKETMIRVRENVEIVHQHLLKLGYQFAKPNQAHISPADNTKSVIEEIENSIGYLPLSFRAFYEEVGSVNFMQSRAQLIHYYEPIRKQAPDIRILGEEDPLYVESVQSLLEESRLETKKLYFCFAPDEFHKADYSGGENSHLWLPDGKADFQIQGMYNLEEYFVEYLRCSFRWGGFRGHINEEPG